MSDPWIQRRSGWTQHQGDAGELSLPKTRFERRYTHPIERFGDICCVSNPWPDYTIDIWRGASLCGSM
jgi:hypothetical protein